MVFQIEGKVAMVTGGANGIGLRIVKELLKHGAKGVTIIDVNKEFGQTAIQEIQEEFGDNKSLFAETDICSKEQFENAYKQTVDKFGNVDILVNNAGVYSDAIWEKEINVNIKGTVNGILLGIHDYLSKHKQGSEAVILNIASDSALKVSPILPIYSCTKAAVLGLTRNWGHKAIYEKTNVKLVAVCPGATTYKGISRNMKYTMNEFYDDIARHHKPAYIIQTAEFLAEQCIRVIKYADSGTVWVVKESEPAFQFIFPDISTMKGNTLAEV